MSEDAVPPLEPVAPSHSFGATTATATEGAVPASGGAALEMGSVTPELGEERESAW